MFILKQLRNDYKNGKKISQKKLAETLGVSRSAVAMWEAGLSEPDNETLIKLANFFNVTTDYLLGTKEKPPLLKGDDAILLKDYHRLSEKKQQVVKDLIYSLLAEQDD